MLTARTDVRLLPDDDRETPTGILVAIGAVAVVAGAFVAVRVPAADEGLRLAVIAAVLAGYGAWALDVRAVLAVVLLAWLVQDGFLLDRFGVLEWRGWSDLVRLGALVAAALVGLAVGAVRRRAIGARRG